MKKINVDLTVAQANQILEMIEERRREGHYWGNKKYFELRETNIVHEISRKLVPTVK